MGADERGERWNFNLSVSIDSAFMDAFKEGRDITLLDGTRISAQQVFDAIASAAHACADPGIIFIDQLHSGNTTPNVGTYESVAPCGETGLMKGETCNFASINIAHFV